MQLRRRLLRWFDRHARDLPWRNQPSPYAIWVSEIMLQQTQVATVVPFFERFLKTFPSLATLAHASQEQILRLWEGLGYYRRARHLHQAAGIVLRDYQGELPRDPQALRRLPGLGRYTANAILSQAFDERLPILEANSRRVLCRLGAVAANPRDGSIEKKLWHWAECLLPRRRAGDFNQAMMELGALVCTAARPACDRCPLRVHCLAYRRGQQHRLPRRTAPVRFENVNDIALLIRRNNKVLLAQRPAQGRWAGLWEFPTQTRGSGETVADVVNRLEQIVGVKLTPAGAPFATLRHGITRYRVQLEGWEARYVSGKFRPHWYVQARWLNVAQLADFPLSSPQRRLAQLLAKAKMNTQ